MFLTTQEPPQSPITRIDSCVSSSSVSSTSSMSTSASARLRRTQDNDDMDSVPPPPPRTKTKEQLQQLQELQKERAEIEEALRILQEEEQQQKQKERLAMQRKQKQQHHHRSRRKRMKPKIMLQPSETQEFTPPERKDDGSDNDKSCCDDGNGSNLYPIVPFNLGHRGRLSAESTISRGLESIIEEQEEDLESCCKYDEEDENDRYYVGGSVDTTVNADLSAGWDLQPLDEVQEETFPYPACRRRSNSFTTRSMSSSMFESENQSFPRLIKVLMSSSIILFIALCIIVGSFVIAQATDFTADNNDGINYSPIGSTTMAPIEPPMYGDSHRDIPVIPGVWEIAADIVLEEDDGTQKDFITHHALSDDGIIMATIIHQMVNSGVVDSQEKNRRILRVYEQGVNKDDEWHQLGSDIDITRKRKDQNHEDNPFHDRDDYYSLDLNANGLLVAVGRGGDIMDYGDEMNHSIQVYEYNGNEWKLFGSVLPYNDDDERIGKLSITLSDTGHTMAVGMLPISSSPLSRETISDDMDNGFSSISPGKVKVYQYTHATSWSQIGQTLTGIANGDQFGWDVSLSADGTIVAVSAIQVSSYDLTASWNQYDYHSNYNDQNEEEKNQNNNQNEIRRLSRITATTARRSSSSAGYVCVFQLESIEASGNSNTDVDHADSFLWKSMGMKLSGWEDGDGFGWSTALSKSGNTLIVGSPQARASTESTARNHGLVYIFKYQNNSFFQDWVHVGPIIAGFEPNDHLGSGVDISADGTKFIAAASNENTCDKGGGYGQVFSMRKNTYTWFKLGDTLHYPTSTTSSRRDQSYSSAGSSCLMVSITANGTSVAMMGNRQTSTFEFQKSAKKL